MFIRLTDGRVAYTDDASFFFILTEPVFRTLIDSISAPPQSTAPRTGVDPVERRKKTGPALTN
jgi:hypothetical protein